MKRWLTLSTLALANAALGQTCDPVESDKILASDAQAFDHFGFAVDVHEDLAVVGAYQDDDNGSSSGSAYLIHLDTSTEGFKLIADDGAASDRFGWSVATDGSHVIVGAYLDDDNGTSSGSAYLFSVATGQQLAKLTAPAGETNDRFGFDVDVLGDRVVIGANGDDEVVNGAGAAYVFDISTPTAPSFAFKLLPTAPGGVGLAGSAVALSMDVIAVGAPADGEFNSDSGACYVYQRSDGTLLQKLYGSDSATGDGLGESVAVSGTTVIVGAPDDFEGAQFAGAAFIFDGVSGTELAKLTPGDPEASAEFGLSVALDGDVAVIGAPGNNETAFDAGAAYVYRGSNWDFEGKLLAADGAVIDELGEAVGISASNGGRAVIGTRRHAAGGAEAGAVYVFELQCGDGCVADIDGDDGMVDVSDLLALLANWGTDQPGAEIAEPLNVVDVSDLLGLLAAWGPC